MTSPDQSPAKRTVRVDLGERSYDILIGPGLIATAANEIASRLKGRRMAVITDEHVAPLYLEPLMASLKAKEITFITYTVFGNDDWFFQTRNVFDGAVNSLGVNGVRHIGHFFARDRLAFGGFFEIEVECKSVMRIIIDADKIERVRRIRIGVSKIRFKRDVKAHRSFAEKSQNAFVE